MYGLWIVVDCVNGVMYLFVFLVFEELGVEVILLVVELDGLNINLNCGFIGFELL